MKKIILLFSLAFITVCSYAQTPFNKLYDNIYNAFSPCPNPSAYTCSIFDNTTDDSTVTIRNLGGSGLDIQAVVNCSTDSIHIAMQAVQGIAFVGKGQLFPYHKIIVTYTVGDTSGSITCTDTLSNNNAPLIS